MQRLHPQQPGLLGSLCPGHKKLQGKTFYLDSVKKRSTAVFLETVSLLGGAVESFLHRDVSFVVTGSQEFLKDPKCLDTKTVTKVSSEEAPHPIMTRESVLGNDKRRLGTPSPAACCSRGKALLEKAMRNNEQLQKGSVLANARSWGVKILFVDDVLLYLKQLTRESFSMNKRPEKAKQQAPRVVKAAALRSPYLKIEDISRKYRPLHMQSMSFPSLWFSGRFSPFESPPPRFDRRAEPEPTKTRPKGTVESSVQNRPEVLPTPSPWRPRRKDLSFCECCHQAFAHLEEHLRSDQHRAFVLDRSNYSEVDGCVAQLLPGFHPDPPSLEAMKQRRTSPPIQEVCELELLTDAETEHVVQDLHNPGSSLAAVGPVDPDPADVQLLPAHTDRYPRPATPTMPVLYVEGLDSAGQQPPCLSPDPYSIPPILSPHSSHIEEPHSPYSEPPVLSPQWSRPADEKEDGHASETDPKHFVFPSVPAASIPVSTSHPPGGGTHRSPPGGATHRSPPGGATHRSPPGGATHRSPPGGATHRSPPGGATHRSPPGGATHRSPPGGATHRSPPGGATHRSPPGGATHRSPPGGATHRSPPGGATHRSPPGGATHRSPPGGATHRSPPGAATHRSPPGGATHRSPPGITRRSRSLPQPSAMTPNPKKRCRSASPEHSCNKRRRISGAWLLSHQVWDVLQTPDPSSPCAAAMLELGQKATANQTVALGHSRTKHWGPLEFHASFPTPDSQQPLSTSASIESALIPNLFLSSSDSEWDCELVTPVEPSCDLDRELLHRPGSWMHDVGYESRLHAVLQQAQCGEEAEPSAFSRAVVQIVEVQH